jgi:hypothetical protein
LTGATDAIPTDTDAGSRNHSWNILWSPIVHGRVAYIGVPYGTSVWQLGDSHEQNGTFKIESKKTKSDTFTGKIRAGLPATLDRSDITRIVNVGWQKYFAHFETDKKALAACGWRPLNHILLDHPELQDTKDRVKSINEIYEKQVRDGVDITDLVTLNTEEG